MAILAGCPILRAANGGGRIRRRTRTPIPSPISGEEDGAPCGDSCPRGADMAALRLAMAPSLTWDDRGARARVIPAANSTGGYACRAASEMVPQTRPRRLSGGSGRVSKVTTTPIAPLIASP